jgi:hypothetical protein
MKSSLPFSILAALALVLAACNVFGGAPSATPPATATTAPPTSPPATEPPTVPAPTATTPPTEPPAPSATPEPAVSPTPPLDAENLETILILEPGPLSRVASPVRVSGLGLASFEQTLVIEVTDEDGNVLSTTPVIVTSELGVAGPYAADVTFSIAAEQAGRISVFDVSARDGGLVHLSSVEVTLLPAGPASIAPANPHAEVHAITLPAHLAEVSGGSLHVEGFSEYVFEATLGLALCGEGGSGAPDLLCGTADNVIALGFAMIAAPDMGLPGPYAGELAYTLSAPVQARLVVYSTSARDGGILHLNSRPITLRP